MTETGPAPFRILPVRSGADLKAAIALFEAYATAIGIDLSYQDFAGEMAAMPGKYAPPPGELLLARRGDGTPLGCVGLRPLTESICEMKRLYVAPEARGLGLGRALVKAMIEQARRIGYREMRLDTLPSMASAIGLYQTFGFAPIPPYYHTPVEGTIFLARQLSD